MIDLFKALFLGFIEGLTEFIPVSSTGHLIITADAISFPPMPGHFFEVFIQLGAILAVIVFYHRKIFGIIMDLPHDKGAQGFVLSVIVATIPAVIAGLLAHKFIKDLYTPQVIGYSLIAGGILILLLEKRLKVARVQTMEEIPLKTALLVGCFQVLALIPGISRSGATIMGGLALGLARPAAAEFSFFLAIPVICGAVLFDSLKNWELLDYTQIDLLLTGFVMSFITALAVLKFAMYVINRWGFQPFAWYRIAAGLLVLAFF